MRCHGTTAIITETCARGGRALRIANKAHARTHAHVWRQFRDSRTHAPALDSNRRARANADARNCTRTGTGFCGFAAKVDSPLNYDGRIGRSNAVRFIIESCVLWGTSAAAHRRRRPQPADTKRAHSLSDSRTHSVVQSVVVPFFAFAPVPRHRQTALHPACGASL